MNFSDKKMSGPIDVLLVRRLFGRVKHALGADFLYREISVRMQERLSFIKILPQRVMDVGCGAGIDLLMLKKRFLGAELIGVDAAQEPLICARRLLRQSFWRNLLTGMSRRRAKVFLICANFAALPLPSKTVNVVWSNLALHWHPQPDSVLAEWRRVLQKDGLLMFSTFGPDTFKELKEAFLILDDKPHTIPFVDMHDLGDMLVDAGFSTPVMDMEVMTITYTDIYKMLNDVRAMGGNPLSTRRRGLIGRAAWSRFTQHLQTLRDAQGNISMTVEVIYGHAFCPAPKKTNKGEAIIEFVQPHNARLR